MTRRIVLCLSAWLLCAGCQSLVPQQQAREEAEQRFNHQKARIKFLLASEQFDHGQITKARETLQEVIGFSDSEPQYYLLLAKIYIEQGELARARELLNALTGTEGGAPESAYLRGLIAERYGNPEEAAEHYRLACEMAPHNADFIMAYGEALIGLNRAAEALTLINQQLEDANDFGRLQMLRAEALQMVGDYAAAAEAYRKAFIEHPHDDSLFESYAMALFWARQYREAVAPLKTLQGRLQQETPLHLLRALATCYLETREPVTALSLVREVTRREPHDAQSWVLYARCMMAVNNAGEARYAAERAARLDPELLDAQLLLGYVLFDQRNWAAAREALDRVIRIDPRDVTALCLLGQISETTGGSAEALEFYRRALEVDAADPLAQRLHARLSQERVPRG